MDNENKQSEDVIKISDPQIEGKEILQRGIESIQNQLKGIKETFNFTLTSVVVVLALGFVTLLFMVATILIDAWHFNSSVYKENKVLDLNSKIIQSTFDQQQDIIKRLENIEKKLKI